MTIQQGNAIKHQDTELLKKTRFGFPLNYREGSTAGDSRPVCGTSGKPSTRLPLGGLGQLAPPREFLISENPENEPQMGPKIKDYPRIGSATSDNRAAGVGPDVCAA